ncbi:hypothetical protein CHS0354_024891 [Potamilus streckersoni]|uniref:Hexosyltransferase n=1 Tax=Potamilus streckersoni TaxID=2493646 RepID=A0AAE0WDB3_9BIVA|nr:hypothetical protein CHS0354_024891 [Potamilus streckersoni]
MFMSTFAVQWVLRNTRLVIALLGISCLMMSVHYISTVNHLHIIRPRIIDLHRQRGSTYSPKAIQSDDEYHTIIHKGEIKSISENLKYHLTTIHGVNISGVNNTRSVYTKTLYPLTLDAPYLLSNQNLCKSVVNLSALVIVHTAPNHFDRRDIMRKTWTNNSYFHHLGSVRILFLLGTVLDNDTQIKIEDEFKKHGDILQGHFIDAYRNLTHKGVMGYKWISENCMNAKMIVKVDDDVVVDTYKLLKEYIPKLSGKNRYILCNYIFDRTMPIIREKNSKWYVASDFFRGYQFYPQYCSGFGVIISTDIIPFLYRAAYLTPFFWVDDVYLYGMLPSKVKEVTYISLARNVSLNFDKGLQCIENTIKQCPFLISDGGNPEEVIQLWNAMGKAYKRTLNVQFTLSNTSHEMNAENTTE